MKEGGGAKSGLHDIIKSYTYRFNQFISLVLLLLLGISINNNFYNTINPSDHVCVLALWAYSLLNSFYFYSALYIKFLRNKMKRYKEPFHLSILRFIYLSLAKRATSVFLAFI